MGCGDDVTRQPVSSSTIRSVGYDRSEGTLEVEFIRGGVYQYIGVPEFLYLGFLLTSSKGQYFNNKIQGRYKERHVD